MQETINGHKVEFYEGIKDLPFEVFKDFNKNVLLESELGSSVQEFDKNIIRITEFIDKKMDDQAKKELLNMRFTVNNILSGVNYSGLAFACMIKKFNGELVEDRSYSNLNAMVEKLSSPDGLKVGKVKESVSDLKKN